MSRPAARLSRPCTGTSSTALCLSTARYNQYFLPLMVTITSSRCHLSPRPSAVERMRRAMPSRTSPTSAAPFQKCVDAARGQQFLDHCKEAALRSRPLLCRLGAAPPSKGLLLSHFKQLLLSCPDWRP
jgi:hypothetical protein